MKSICAVKKNLLYPSSARRIAYPIDGQISVAPIRVESGSRGRRDETQTTGYGNPKSQAPSLQKRSNVQRDKSPFRRSSPRANKRSRRRKPASSCLEFSALGPWNFFGPCGLGFGICRRTILSGLATKKRKGHKKARGRADFTRDRRQIPLRLAGFAFAFFACQLSLQMPPLIITSNATTSDIPDSSHGFQIQPGFLTFADRRGPRSVPPSEDTARWALVSSGGEHPSPPPVLRRPSATADLRLELPVSSLAA